MKKSTIFLTIILSILGLIFLSSLFVNADSGWDVDYDSGWDSDWGSSSWDSDWGSSSWDSDWDDYDWDYSSSNNSSYSGFPSGVVAIVVFQLFVVLIIIAIISDVKKQSNLTRASYRTFNENIYNDKHLVAMLKIKEEINDFNEKEFNDLVYDKYIKIQNAWSEFNLDELKDQLTDELYNTYNSQLKVLKAKKEKNIMTDFERQKVSIIDFQRTNKEYTVKVLLKAKFYDYIINQHDVVLRGKKDIKVEMTYILTFVRKQIIEDNKCPNCGAPLNNKYSNKCPYCKSNLVSDNYDWTLSKKEAINQRWDY